MKTFVEPYINFDGNAEEAFHFYQRVFDAPEPMIMKFKDVPYDEETDPEMADFDPEGTMHASLKLGDITLMGSDSPPGRHDAPAGVYISWATDDLEQVKQVWQRFIHANSEILMNLEKTFWSELYGILRDPYGVLWMIQHHDPEES